MKAIVCEERGGPETMRLRDMPEPQPGPEQVAIRVEACGVNYADVMMRYGLYPGSPEPPFIPGFEVCGTVAATGEGASEFQPGERVAGLLRNPQHGGYAEVAVVDQKTVAPWPERFSIEEGAAFPINFLTAYGCLKLCGHLQAGETVLIHSAAGGVGTAAAQLAKRWGARVIGTAGSDEKLSKARELGADVAINYRTGDFAEQVKKATDGAGVDLVIDPIGGEVFEKNLRLLKKLGRVIVVGLSSREPNTPKTSSLLFNTWGVFGFHMSAMWSRPGLFRSCLDELTAMLAAGEVHPVIGHRLGLNEAAEAHRLMEERENIGKIVLFTGTSPSKG